MTVTTTLRLGRGPSIKGPSRTIRPTVKLQPATFFMMRFAIRLSERPEQRSVADRIRCGLPVFVAGARDPQRRCAVECA
jgi:hypothetical protein